MPDWHKLVRNRLQPLNRIEKADAVVSELAAHLEETYDAARARGLVHDAAVALTLQEVRNWRVLANDISRAKSQENFMTKRTRTLWLPAMANLIAAPGLLMILQKLGVQPRVIWFGNMAIVLYLPWLITLPMFGGFGASLSRRVQGSSLSRLIAGLAPALAILGVFAFVLPASLASLFFCTAHLTGFPWLYFGLTVCNWVVLPACALLIGALPFLKGSLPSKTLIGENNHA